MKSRRLAQVAPAVRLYRLRADGWHRGAEMTPAEAARTIKASGGRIVAVDPLTGRAVHATRPADEGRTLKELEREDNRGPVAPPGRDAPVDRPDR